MTLDQFITQHNGKHLDRDGVYGYQCVDIARQYIAEVLAVAQPAGVRGAADFWTQPAQPCRHPLTIYTIRMTALLYLPRGYGRFNKKPR